LFRLTPPSEDEVRHFIGHQEQSPFSYPDVGATASALPAGYDVDHNRVRLGEGEAAWQRARDAIRAWEMFHMPWVRLYWPDTPIQPGAVVAVSFRHFGFFSLNACRIVYVVSENGSAGAISRFGFAYGTLREHAERGEERFTVEWNHQTDEVCYDILAFSRPRAALAKLAYPVSRTLQRRFVYCSKLAMQRSVQS
jgi:uncharacterized protein (UPF0548 family)